MVGGEGLSSLPTIYHLPLAYTMFWFRYTMFWFRWKRFVGS